MERKGKLMYDNFGSLVIAAAIIIILLMMFYMVILKPNWNRGEEAAKSYLETLEIQIKIAERGETGEFEILDLARDDIQAYIINFNEEFGITTEQGHTFLNPVPDEHSICICYSEKGGKTSCECLKMKGELILKLGEEEERKKWISYYQNKIKSEEEKLEKRKIELSEKEKKQEETENVEWWISYHERNLERYKERIEELSSKAEINEETRAWYIGENTLLTINLVGEEYVFETKEK